MSDIGERIRGQLWEMQDVGYKDFHAKLIPTVDPEAIIGVRTPEPAQVCQKAGEGSPDWRFPGTAAPSIL